MDIYPDFHGPHALEPQPNAERVEWRLPVARFPRARVIKHSCHCGEPAYELCAGSGLAWVRTTEWTGAGVVVRESHPTGYAAAEELWIKIMDGRAR